jgi:D-beta-D-heptose 7-phosphate kinase/D-beta-D-heptose 1-phosphate adenosyltransferase
MWEEQLVASLKGARVAVCGDAMLDHYVLGAVSRISPEAPVPVLHVASERHVLGGAANVAANIAALGGQARLLGVIGDDFAGRLMVRMLEEAGGCETGLIVQPGGVTIIKTRYLGGQQQLVRVDRERTDPPDAEVTATLMAGLEDALQTHDVFVLSDYGKGALCDGVLDRFLPMAAARGKRVIVDPKRRDFGRYRGAFLITPNRREMEEATGLPCQTDAEAGLAAAAAMDRSGAGILLTRSERGMSLYQPGHEPTHLSAEAREVFDVSGAGDTVVAVMAAGLAGGQPVAAALRAANAAAGVVVSKLGTATCSPDELLASLTRASRRRVPGLDERDLAHAPAATLVEAVEAREAWRRAGLVVGFANGCFDLLHPGHVTLLRKAAEQCDRLIVAINSDASVTRLKGPSRPVQTEVARATVLQAIKGVDQVIVFGEDTPLEAIRALVPDILFKGSDYTEDQVVGGPIVRAAGGRVALIDLVAGHSTTALVQRANLGPA